MSAPVKVMMVDDDDVQLTVVKAWLEAERFQVVTHNSPFGTNKLLLREQPDVLLLDVEMPGLEGAALAEMLAKQKSKLKIIFFSGKDREKLDALVKSTGAVGAIRKGRDPTQFMDQFKRLIK